MEQCIHEFYRKGETRMTNSKTNEASLTARTASDDLVEIVPTTNKLVRCERTGKGMWLDFSSSPAMEICPMCSFPKGKGVEKCNFTIEKA